MSANNGIIEYSLKLDTALGTASLKKLKNGFEGFGDTGKKAAKKTQGGFDALFSRLGNVNLSIELIERGFRLLEAGVLKVIEAGAKFESLQLQLKKVLNSASKAKYYFEWIKNFAASTPFQMENLTSAVITLESFGINAKTHLKTLGDTAAALNVDINDLARVMGQVWAKPRASQEEMLQLVERGIPVYKILREELGLTAAEAAEIGKTGVSGIEAFNALIQGMSTRYNGTMKEMSGTWNGLVSTLKDNFELFLAKIAGSGPLDTFKEKVSAILEKIQELNDNGTLDNWAAQIGDLFVVASDTLSGIVSIIGILAGALHELKGIYTNFITDVIGLNERWKNNFDDILNHIGNPQIMALMALNKIKKEFDLKELREQREEFERAQKIYQEIKPTLERIAPEFNKLKNSLVNVKERIFDTVSGVLGFSSAAEEATEKVKDAAKAVEDSEVYKKLADKLTLTSNEYKALQTESAALALLFKNKKTEILGHIDNIDDWQKKVDSLVNEYIRAGKDVPGPLNDIKLAIDAAAKAAYEASPKFFELSSKIADLAEKKAVKLIEKAGDLKNVGLDPAAESANEFDKKIEGAGISNKNFIESIINDLPTLSDFESIIMDITDNLGNFARVGQQAVSLLSDLGVIGENTGKALNQSFSGLGTISGGINSIKNAGNGLEGILGSLSGGFSIAAGAISILSGALSLFESKGELQAAERRLYGLTGLTQDWSSKIEEMAKSMGGADSAGRAFNLMLADIINTSNISVDNFQGYINKVREIIATYQQGNASLAETKQNFAAAFGAIAKKAADLNLEGGAAMTGLIMLADETGMKIREVTDYVKNNMKSGFEGYKQYLTGEFSTQTLGVFEDMLALEKKVGKNQTLINGIQGASNALIGLSNATRLTEEQFQSFENIGTDAFKKLTDQGFTSEEALMQMKPLLERLAFLQEEFGYTIDDSTQKMIDQAVESGILSDDMRSDSDIMKDGFGQLNDTLLLIAKTLGADLPEALGFLEEQTESSINCINNDLDSWGRGLGKIQNQVYDLGNTADWLDQKYKDAISENTINKEFDKMDMKVKDVTSTVKTLSLPILKADEAARKMYSNTAGAAQGAAAFLQEYNNEIFDLERKLKEISGQMALTDDARLREKLSKEFNLTKKHLEQVKKLYEKNNSVIQAPGPRPMNPADGYIKPALNGKDSIKYDHVLKEIRTIEAEMQKSIGNKAKLDMLQAALDKRIQRIRDLNKKSERLYPFNNKLESATAFLQDYKLELFDLEKKLKEISNQMTLTDDERLREKLSKEYELTKKHLEQVKKLYEKNQKVINSPGPRPMNPAAGSNKQALNSKGLNSYEHILKEIRTIESEMQKSIGNKAKLDMLQAALDKRLVRIEKISGPGTLPTPEKIAEYEKLIKKLEGKVNEITNRLSLTNDEKLREKLQKELALTEQHIDEIKALYRDAPEDIAPVVKPKPMVTRPTITPSQYLPHYQPPTQQAIKGDEHYHFHTTVEKPVTDPEQLLEEFYNGWKRDAKGYKTRILTDIKQGIQ